jgi:hypothetical protein
LEPDQIERPVFDHRIGQQSFAQEFKLLLGRGLVRGFDLHLNGLANSQAGHP